jgi:predicted site-specific integrase-resolvase
MADLQIDIEEFPLWFAETLSAAVKTDLTGVMALLRSIQSTINSIHNISVSLREVAAAQPQAAAQLSARCIKLCDQLDTYLVQQFGSAPPILPGASHVTELCQRLKNRIKTVDDMASSSKLTKSDEIIQSKLTSLRNHFHDLQSQIEDLEALHSNKSIVTEFIDEVKVPLDALSKLLEERARLSEGKSSRERVIEIHGSISSQRSRGSAALCNEAMHRWIVLQELRARLEIALSDMLSCIHAMFNQSKGQASLAPEHKGLRAVFGGAQSARDSVRLPEFR